jgi:hypothetical protein
MAAALCAGTPAYAQKASGADIKAAFIFNFTRFIEWPADQLSEGRPLTIVVIGNDAIADALSTIAHGKQVQGRTVAVRRLAINDEMPEAHVVFVGGGEHARIPSLIKRLGSSGANALTISDVDRFCQSGGIIEFRTEADRIRFDVNLQNANTAGLAINSKLLSLARTVHPSAKAQ